MATNIFFCCESMPGTIAWRVASVASTMLVASTVMANIDILDSRGFEAPSYTTTAFGNGMLECQTVDRCPFGPLSNPENTRWYWHRTTGAGPSTGTIQNNIFAPGGGTQSVRLSIAANANDTWGVPISGPPVIGHEISIDWSMRVEKAVLQAGAQFGPFVGVEAFDGAESNNFRISALRGLVGSLGVDTRTGAVRYRQADTGNFTDTGTVVSFGSWHNYEIRLNYLTHQYSVFMDGFLLRTEGFVDQNNVPGGIDSFGFVGLGIRNLGNNAQGEAYFDNYYVYEVADISFLRADYNLDGSVDAADYVVWRDAIGKAKQGYAAILAQGGVDRIDYHDWTRDFGKTVNSGADSNALPEPSSILLFMASLAFLSACRDQNG